MTDRDPLRVLCEELAALRIAAGNPTYRKIHIQASRQGEHISHSGVGTLLNGQGKPRWGTVRAFVLACWSCTSRGGPVFSANHLDLTYWQALHDATGDITPAQTDDPTPAFEDSYLPPHAWQHITGLVAALPTQITPDELVRLLWDAVDDVGPLVVDSSYELLPLLRDLDTRYVPPGSMPPALALLEYVAAVQLGFVQRRLRSLIDDLAGQSRVDAREAARVRDQATRQRGEARPVSVFIKVEPDERDYRLTAWLYRADSIVTFKREAADRYSTSHLRVAVEALIAEVGPLVRGVDLGQLTFEFVLPWNLLGEVVERWLLDDGRSIGNLSPVVVRSLERMRDPWAAAEWRRRSDLLYRRDAGMLDELVVTGSIQRGRNGLPPGSACIAADGPYVAPQGWRDDHPLLAALKDGLPVALWHHGGGDPQWLVELVQGAVSDAGLDRLPTEVLRRRRSSAGADGDELSVCLLWDDYHRQPESVSCLAQPMFHGGDR